MTRGCILFLTLAALFVLQIDSASACQQIGKTKNGEPLCATSSDFGDRRRFVSKRVQAIRDAEMKRGGRQVTDLVVVSPYVPGSNKDKAWQAERKRKGFCSKEAPCR